MNGVLNLYKPRGITSSDAVVRVKRILGTKAVGHMGTLDPAGEGVLLLGVGKGTRLFDLFLKKDKVYEAEFAFGYETDTLDGDGTVIKTTAVLPSQALVAQKTQEFIGSLQQMPPAFSAKSVGGVRAYKLARQGKDVPLQPANVQVFDFKLLHPTAENAYSFRIHCSSGTYIRSLCRDLAHALGSLATMTAIKRMRCGAFRIEDALSLEALEAQKAAALLPLPEVLAFLPKVELCDECFVPLCHGVRQAAAPGQAGDFTVYCKGELFGIGCNEGGKIRIKTYLREDN